jgi:acyl carrier protein
MNHSNGDPKTPAGAETIQAWMILKLSAAFGVAPSEIDPAMTFDTLGMDSLTAFNLTGDLADWLGRDLPATLLWDYPSVGKLSHRLAEDLAAGDATRLHDQLQRLLAEVKASVAAPRSGPSN